ncbi:hypothetical protein [Hymenobacter psychrotolerans]|uniref:DUF4303 domain-containing protein n=1 Tax=Hymenobacter psychrotolerans DSM 18569 TaxID=1121959 RepID=A0A1M6Y3Y1_9BACT|nr:hypothetical protein [Hymenobacter psychrotolerans]SHL12912.1 hypothetical protein SAMN02746009_02177 [Hymenobacter psychrotolerans DSM 18569]
MKKKAFDFEALGESLRADTQEFIDSYAAKYPEDGPILGFSLYFDSQGSVHGLILPQRALSQQISVDDTATWFQYADHVDAPLSERTEELLSEYEEVFLDDEADEEENEAVIQQFHQMITATMQRLTFEKLPKTDDFVFYADAMDEDYEAWSATIPPALLKKHFDQ